MAKNTGLLVININKDLRDQFHECCKANDENMTRIITAYIKAYVSVNKHKVLGGE